MSTTITAGFAGATAPLEEFMKNVLSTFALVATMSMLSLLTPAFAENSSVPSKSELKTLLKMAKTHAEHQAIAAYYRHQAEVLRADSKEHLASADLRAKNPNFAALEAKHGFAFGLGASHCRYWASLDSAEARRADKLASVHEKMAVEAEHNAVGKNAITVASLSK